MKPKAILRMAVDVLMLILLIFLMAYWMIGERLHEWLGIAIAVLYLFHHILNRQWFPAVFRGKYNALRTLGLVVNLLLLAGMLCQIISGLILSRYVLNGLDVPGNLMLARSVHHTAAYWNFILMAFHLGLHWKAILQKFRSMARFSEDSRLRTVWLRAIGILAALYGVVAFRNRNIGSYLFLRQMFTFFDDREPLLFFFMDYLAIMALFILAGHGISCLLKCVERRTE